MRSKWLVVWLFAGLAIAISLLSANPLVILIAILYFLPSFITQARGLGYPEARMIVLLNFLTSWLVITWIVALVMSLAYHPKKLVDGPVASLPSDAKWGLERATPAPETYSGGAVG